VPDGLQGPQDRQDRREAKQLDSFDPSIRDNMEFREALARRDIATVYRLLCTTMGYSQRDISRLTEQSQSEISEILKGRQVQGYGVLVRIADGLGIPRGWMGLAHDATTIAEMRRTDNETEPRKEESESVKRRRYLAATATIMFGGNAVFGSATKPIGVGCDGGVVCAGVRLGRRVTDDLPEWHQDPGLLGWLTSL